MSHILGVVGKAISEDLQGYRRSMLDAMGIDPNLAVRMAEAPGAAMAHVQGKGREIPLAGGGLLGPGPGLLGAAEGVLDNRAELGPALSLDQRKCSDMQDSELMHLAFQRWGQDSVHHLLGDYVWGYWDPKLSLLTLGRDHNGNSVLFLSNARGLLAFSTCRMALEGLSWVGPELDPLAMAATIANLNPLPTHTVRQDIQVMPPAHTATWNGQSIRLRRYWFPEETKLWNGQSDETYQEALLTGIEDSAGRMYMRAKSPALTLSAGLDSGALAWAWTQTPAQKAGLATYCATPIHDTQPDWPDGFLANELPGAQSTASLMGLSGPISVGAEDWNPLRGIEYMLQANLEPSVGVGNMYWIAALLETASQNGHDLLMTGQQGNGTFSWYGRPWTRSFLDLATQHSLPYAMRHKLVRPLLRMGLANSFHRVSRGLEPWIQATLLQAEKARQLHLREYVSQTAFDSQYVFVGKDARIPRLRVIEPGRNRVGMRWAERGHFHGIRIRDATASKDLVELCLSIPDAVWSGPKGSERWLTRQAMHGKLPQQTTSQLTRGRQSADLFQRLRDQSSIVSSNLEALSLQNEVFTFLNVAKALEVWNRLLTEPFTHRHQQACLTTVMPALGIGLFLANQKRLAD